MTEFTIGLITGLALCATSTWLALLAFKTLRDAEHHDRLVWAATPAVEQFSPTYRPIPEPDPEFWNTELRIFEDSLFGEEE